MRVAVFSDVQANLQAMQVVVDDILAWRPHLVVMNGDLVNRGPTNLPCLELFDALRRRRAWLPLRGNHEDWVMHCAEQPPDSPVEADMRRFTDWAAQELGEKRALMSDWPDHLSFPGPKGEHWVHVTHGSMKGNRLGVSQNVSEAELAERLPEDVALFVGAHTHKALHRRFRGMEIINVGSVGSPFDGDTRASYGRLEYRNSGWHSEIVRLSYDRAATERAFRDSGFLDQGGPLALIIFEEWNRARMLIRFWSAQYQEAVLAGEIELQWSVERFLSGID
jgi:hypothetical protein